MARPIRIHTDKLPSRLHYVVEWAEKRGLKQADIVRELGVEKSTVSRWFSGRPVSEIYLVPLGDLLQIEPLAIYRHPEDDWMAERLRGKSKEVREQAIEILEAFLKRA